MKKVISLVLIFLLSLTCLGYADKTEDNGDINYEAAAQKYQKQVDGLCEYLQENSKDRDINVLIEEYADIIKESGLLLSEKEVELLSSNNSKKEKKVKGLKFDNGWKVSFYDNGKICVSKTTSSKNKTANDKEMIYDNTVIGPMSTVETVDGNNYVYIYSYNNERLAYMGIACTFAFDGLKAWYYDNYEAYDQLYKISVKRNYFDDKKYASGSSYGVEASGSYTYSTSTYDHTIGILCSKDGDIMEYEEY